MAEDCPFRPPDPRPARYDCAQAGIPNHQPASLSVSTHFAYWLLESYDPTPTETPESWTWAHLATGGPGRTLTWLPLGLGGGLTCPPRRARRPTWVPLLSAPLRPLWSRLCAAAALHAGLSGHGEFQPTCSVCLERQSRWEYVQSLSRVLAFRVTALGQSAPSTERALPGALPLFAFG